MNKQAERESQGQGNEKEKKKFPLIMKIVENAVEALNERRAIISYKL